MPLAVWLDGPLDVAALREACAAVAARHPVLGGTFAEHDGELRLTALPVPALTEGADLDQALAEPLDLAEGPAARFTLIREEPKRHLLLIQAHHAVFDGESKDVLLRDLAALYGGTEPEPLSSTYEEVAELRRSALAAGLPAAREYWAGRWHDERELRLPGLRGASRVAAPGDAVDFVVRDLGRLAERLEVSRFEALLAALLTLLRAYGNARPVVGVDLSTRDERTRDHVGPFVNELPVGPPAAGGDTFAAFATALRAELRGLYRHRDVPLARAVDGISPRAALTPVSLSYRARTAPGPLFAGLGTSVEWMMFNGWTRGTLHLQVVDDEAGTAARLQFDPAALARADAELIRDHLTRLLAAVTADPAATLDGLPLPAEASAATVSAVAADAPAAASGDAAGGALLAEVQGIFADVLNLDAVDPDDDLFDLGGHSLTITQIMAIAHERYGVELSFELFIDDATPARVAAEIDGLREDAC